ncbi:MAG: squalene/phytoene synthase family protein [Anaerolineae bacterium]
MLPFSPLPRDPQSSVLESELFGWRDSAGATVVDPTAPVAPLVDGSPEASGMLAARITRAASKQTYYTIRCLVDRDRVDDAYRAYAYFRWVDDNLDLALSDYGDRRAFLDRQQSLLARCLPGDGTGAPDVWPAAGPSDSHSPTAMPSAGPTVRPSATEELMLVHLLGGKRPAAGHDRGLNDRGVNDHARSDHAANEHGGLRSYVRNMMGVMEFDVGRRGRLVSEADLRVYERLLATAVTEALHHFIGYGRPAPRDESRYQAARGAHIAHLLRDSHDDVATGYYNVPNELLSDYGIGPGDFVRKPYRDWVRTRVAEARECFAAGRDYLLSVESKRCRLAGHCYIARFEGVLDAVEADGYVLRPDYSDVKRRCAAAQAGWAALCAAASAVGPRRSRP